MADMLKDVPFVPEMAGAIRAAWNPEKASGPLRGLLLRLCQALAPYLRNYPSFIVLFDEIPDFAIEFSKVALGCGAIYSKRPNLWSRCFTCGCDISLTDDDLSECGMIYHPKSTLAVRDGSFEVWFCSRSCFSQQGSHDHCEICKRWEMW